MSALLFSLLEEKTPEWYEQQLGLYRLALSAADEHCEASHAAVATALAALAEHGFIGGWSQAGRPWTIQAGATYGPFTTSEAVGFAEGCRAMGAGV